MSHTGHEVLLRDRSGHPEAHSLGPAGALIYSSRLNHGAPMRRLVAAALLLMASNAGAWTAEAETLEVSGQAGVLGEWELTAKLTATGARKEFSGPMVMKHVGICSVDGPEQKTGEIKLQLSSTSR